ncbi:hypothetical protein IMCC26134_12150 [Verrucomicrobia bacterium IMCC26134]|nr:hypothetical protein IMCC26134_12150 [Verrucomicrobia bacterium IMCC26134]
MKIAAVLFAAACLFTTFSARALAQAAPAAKTAIEAVLVVASKAPGKADPRLAAYDTTLRRVLRFESFQYVGRGRAALTIPGESSLDLGGGQHLELKTAPAADQRLHVQVSWFDGPRLRMNTVLVLRPGIPAVLGGPARADGAVYAIILTAN